MTTAEYQQLFFSTIQRAPGQPADDYEAVLGASGIPAGLPPYTVPQASQPFAAMTQQIGSDGRIAGRVFLPTAIPDDLGYYAHPFSPLRDGPTPGSLVWEWRDLGGPPVVTPGDATAPPSSGSLTEAQVQAMIDAALVPRDARLAALEASVASLQAMIVQPLHAHGAVNLPIVVESLTSMRAKGDIDVDVLPGTATPPPPSSGEDLSGAKVLLWLLRREDAEEGTP
jgi:hypothetical protein